MEMEVQGEDLGFQVWQWSGSGPRLRIVSSVAQGWSLPTVALRLQGSGLEGLRSNRGRGDSAHLGGAGCDAGHLVRALSYWARVSWTQIASTPVTLA